MNARSVLTLMALACLGLANPVFGEDEVLPFDAVTAARSEAEAQEAQRAWAKRIGVEVETANSIGMKMRLIPPGEFLMGSHQSPEEVVRLLGGEVADAEDEHPQHRVTISKAFLMGSHEVTRGQFAQFVAESGYRTDAERVGSARKGKDGGLVGEAESKWWDADFAQSDADPVVRVSLNDAQAFCAWLSKKEGMTYRLPTEAQWEYACRAGSRTAFAWGDTADEGKGWANAADQAFKQHGDSGTECFNWDDGHVYTAPVGIYRANAWGLYDMHGNVAEWCEDWHGQYPAGAVTDPTGHGMEVFRVYRGGGWNDDATHCRSAKRSHRWPSERIATIGFRVVCISPEHLPVRQCLGPAGVAGSGALTFPRPTVAAKAWQRAWAKHVQVEVETTNSIGMKMRVIPPGEFTMGSPREQRPREYDEDTHRVHVSKPFLMGTHEVTRGQFSQFIQESGYRTDAERLRRVSVFGGAKVPWRETGFPQNDAHPVVNVSWNDAQAFCAWLSKKDGKTYRLPTEAEWEYACRAGTRATYAWGDDADGVRDWSNLADQAFRRQIGNVAGVAKWDDGHAYTAPVGSYQANAWGLHDMIGNVEEWCEDWHGKYPASVVSDPTGPGLGERRVKRGASWCDYAESGRPARRFFGVPTAWHESTGFRVVCELPELPQ